MNEYCSICFEQIDKGCGFLDWLSGDHIICGNCQRLFHISDVDTYIETLPIHVLYQYDEELENLIYQYKESRDIALAPVFFYNHVKQIQKRYKGYHIVIMPSNEEKIKERTFHHMLEMLRDIHLPIIDPFTKTSYRKQSLQTLEERYHIADIITLKQDVDIPDTPLLLVDDVLTTGSTIKAAYHLLKQHTYKIEALLLCAHPRFLEICPQNRKRTILKSYLKRKERRKIICKEK